jgi:hypothetical protein
MLPALLDYCPVCSWRLPVLELADKQDQLDALSGLDELTCCYLMLWLST